MGLYLIWSVVQFNYSNYILFHETKYVVLHAAKGPLHNYVSFEGRLIESLKCDKT